jgi:hypothetical protein
MGKQFAFYHWVLWRTSGNPVGWDMPSLFANFWFNNRGFGNG